MLIPQSVVTPEYIRVPWEGSAEKKKTKKNPNKKKKKNRLKERNFNIWVPPNEEVPVVLSQRLKKTEIGDLDKISRVD